MAPYKSLLAYSRSQSDLRKYLQIRKLCNYVFVSSSQSIREREMLSSQILEINRSWEIPIYPILMEKEYAPSISNLSEQIYKNMLKSKYFIAILNENQSRMTEEEVQKSFTEYSNDRILIFIKANKETCKVWDSVICKIKKKKIKYLPYRKTKDLKNELIKWIKFEFRNYLVS
jgi:hypothetical protein